MLGRGNEKIATRALSEWPRVFHIGGGMDDRNASLWIQAGAGKIIVTSFLFADGKFQPERLKRLVDKVGKDKLVIDLSCRRTPSGWTVAMNRWQDLTDTEVNEATISLFQNLAVNSLSMLPIRKASVKE